MNELLIPEDLLQLEKLKFEIELHDFDISFLGLIGIDTRELMLSFNKYFKKYLKGVIRVLFLIFVEMN